MRNRFCWTEMCGEDVWAGPGRLFCLLLGGDLSFFILYCGLRGKSWLVHGLLVAGCHI